MPYSFNNSFDTNTGYRTKSILTIPLNTLKGKTIAVIQIINKKDESGNIQSFTETDELYVSFFASNASSAIERSRITREMVLRMVKMAELRDPKETGAHVNRVGAYCIEIYEKWARGKGLAEHEIKSNKDIFRIAAMLHDVGKVAIPDAILKKPGKLDESEYEIMKTHCYQGSLLFPDEYSQLDAISKEVAYTHHEKWNGTGYPRGLSNDSISIFGRITSLADVYDALISKRVYKEAWDEKDVLKLIKDSSGKDFDPDVVEAFLSIYDIIAAIRNKYPDTGA